MPDESFVIFLNGSYGVGKSSTLDHAGDLLAAAACPFSLMDVDWFHRSWPPRRDDPDNVLTEAENMAQVWGNYRRTGPRQAVVAGVIATQQDRERYQQVFGLPVRSVRLTASSGVADERLRRRYTEHQSDALNWHLERHDQLARELDSADLDELAIKTDYRTPHAVAERVLGHFSVGQTR